MLNYYNFTIQFDGIIIAELICLIIAIRYNFLIGIFVGFSIWSSCIFIETIVDVFYTIIFQLIKMAFVVW